MFRFAHVCLIYITSVIIGFMLFFSSCYATPQRAPLDPASALASAQSEALIAKQHSVNSPSR